MQDQQQNLQQPWPPAAAHETLPISNSGADRGAPNTQGQQHQQQHSQVTVEDDMMSHYTGRTPDPQGQRPSVMSKAEEIRFKNSELALARFAIEAMDAQIETEKNTLLAQLEDLMQKRMAKCWEILRTALGVDISAEADLNKKNRTRGEASLAFCFVIIGIELDLLGFMCVFPYYWNLTSECPSTPLINGIIVEPEDRCDIVILRILLICMSCAYMFCVVAYMHLLDPQGWTPEIPFQDDVTHMDCNFLTQFCPDSMKDKSRVQSVQAVEDATAKVLQMRVRAPVQLNWIHFIPMLRFMLLIKSIDENDVEAVFRVNSLSSFTLGAAQVMGLLFTVMNFNGNFAEMNIFVYVNMLSQMVNWTITFVYFATPIANMMANSITVDAYTRNVETRISDEILQLVYCMERDAEGTPRQAFEDETPAKPMDARSNLEGEGRRKAVELEIKMMKNISVPLDVFTPTEVLSIRRILLKHWGQEFANC